MKSGSSKVEAGCDQSMKCDLGTLEMTFNEPTNVRFEFDGELSLQQRMTGHHVFELCGLVPAANGRLVLFLNGKPTKFWDCSSRQCDCC